MKKFERIITATATIILIVISFILGRRWESFDIKNQIDKSGVAVSQYGDNDYIVIYGTYKKYSDCSRLYVYDKLDELNKG